MSLQRTREHREELEALISRGVGIIEIQKTLGVSYAALRDMIRLLHLPKPLDQRTQRTGLSASPRRARKVA